MGRAGISWRKVALPAALACSVAAQAQGLADAEYVFRGAEWDRTGGTCVRIVPYRTIEALHRAATDAHVQQVGKRKMSAFSQMSTNPEGICTIHILDPSRFNVRTILGHEVMHCLYGRWHS